MELKIQTDVGELTAVLVSDIRISNHATVWTAWLKEYPAVVTQANSIQEVLDELPKILDLLFEVEIEHLMKD